jgi:PAS domain S-box-containing protein
VFSARPDGYVDYFNQRWFDYLGVPLAALEGWGWTSLIHPDDREEHLRRWHISMGDGQPAVYQSRVADANGEYRWLLHRTEALRDEGGNVTRWFGTSIDSLQAVRRIRTDVMRFDPDGPCVSDLSELRKWVTLLQKLANLGVT